MIETIDGIPVVTQFTGEHRFLSNFWASPVAMQGIVYPTVEHAFQAAKSLDAGMRRHICDQRTPGDAKRAGRQLVLRSDWEVIKLDVMLQLLRAKFSDPYLGQRLLATGYMQLVEGNTWNDTYWGVCRGNGKNHLGRLLMQVRGEIA